MSFHPIEAVTGAIVVPALVFLIPIHVAVLGLVLAIMTVMGIGNHMGWEMFPRALVHGPAGRWLITATHPQRHHAAYRGNYGLYRSEEHTSELQSLMRNSYAVFCFKK